MMQLVDAPTCRGGMKIWQDGVDSGGDSGADQLTREPECHGEMFAIGLAFGFWVGREIAHACHASKVRRSTQSYLAHIASYSLIYARLLRIYL